LKAGGHQGAVLEQVDDDGYTEDFAEITTGTLLTLIPWQAPDVTVSIECGYGGKDAKLIKDTCKSLINNLDGTISA
jgi:hypothetical protein